MTEQSDGCSGETLLAPCTRKKMLQSRRAIVVVWFSCLCLKDQLGLCSLRWDDGELFCELASTIGFCKKRKSAFSLWLHYTINWLRFYSNLLIHFWTLSISYSDISWIQKNRPFKSHCLKSVLIPRVWWKLLTQPFVGKMTSNNSFWLR